MPDGDACCHVLLLLQTKTAKEPLSVMAELHLLVTKEEAPEVYNLAEGDDVEVGPFQGAGIDLKGSPLAAIYRCASHHST